MRIVIPMAGASRRFVEKGYETPKAFLDIDGRPMIHWVCDMFSTEDEFVLLVRQEHLANDRYRRILEISAPRIELIPVEPNDKGPLYTALSADPVVDDAEPVIFTYCDFYQHWHYRQFLHQCHEYDGGIATFRGFHPASFGDTYYAYIRRNARNEMIELREKQSFTDMRHEEPASSGVYYVRQWQLYKKYAQRVLSDRSAVGGEYYISLIYNLMVEHGLHVTTFDIDRFICWGTPEDLEQYRFWSSYFRDDVHKLIGR